MISTDTTSTSRPIREAIDIPCTPSDTPRWPPRENVRWEDLRRERCLAQLVHHGSSLAAVTSLDVFDHGDHPLNATDDCRQALFDNVGSDRHTSEAQPSAADGGGE